jgi:hypothetical protein
MLTCINLKDPCECACQLWIGTIGVHSNGSGIWSKAWGFENFLKLFEPCVQYVFSFLWNVNASKFGATLCNIHLCISMRGAIVMFFGLFEVGAFCLI